MTTEVTIGENPDLAAQTGEITLAVEAVHEAAIATAHVEVVTEALAEIEHENEVLENQMEELQQWQTTLATGVSETRETTQQLATAFQVMAETQTQMLSVLQTLMEQQVPKQPLSAEEAVHPVAESSAQNPLLETPPAGDHPKEAAREQAKQAPLWI